MQISRLQLFLVFLLLAGGGYVAYDRGWIPGWGASKDEGAGQSPMAATPQPPPAVPAPTARAAAEPAPAATSTTPGAYEVTQGDTLWSIARDHSPVKAGAGWVGVWKANKARIRDFDRLETGWQLDIPQTRQAYVTAFWKPRRFEVALWPGEIDLAQLPVPHKAGRIDLAALLDGASSIEPAGLPVPEASDAHGFVVSAFHPPAPSFLPLPIYR